MKRRSGFVSNSSSCSFTLTLPGYPESAEELCSWMFPDGEEKLTVDDFWGCDTYLVEELADHLYKAVVRRASRRTDLEQLAGTHGGRVPLTVKVSFEDNSGGVECALSQGAGMEHLDSIAHGRNG